MDYYVNLNENERLRVNVSLMGSIKLYHNDKEIQRSKGKGKPFIISKADGTTSQVTFKGGFDVVPAMYVDNQQISLAPKSPVYVYILSFLPAILLVGGVIGGILAALAITINMGIFRSKLPTVAKIFLALLILVVATILYLSAAVALVGVGN